LLPVMMTSAAPSVGGDWISPAHEAPAAPSDGDAERLGQRRLGLVQRVLVTVCIASTRPNMSSTARGIAILDAMPSAYVSTWSPSIGRPSGERAGHRVGALRLDPDDPCPGGRVPEPRADPVDQRAIADRHGRDREPRKHARVDRIGHFECQTRRSRRDPRIVAVDQELRPALGGVSL
jgi:hypothetical protein